MTDVGLRSDVRPDLEGQVAVVTGGGRGVGVEISFQLASAGAHVVLVGRTEGSLRETEENIRQAGFAASHVVGSVESERDVKRVFSHTRDVRGKLKIIVNNAGIVGPTKPMIAITRAEWDEVLAVNLTGVFQMCRAAIPLLKAAGGGRIINIGSATGKRPLINRAPYAASKLAIVGLTRTLAHEVGGDGITVNTISPFLIDGPRLQEVLQRMAVARGATPEEMYAELASSSPFRRGPDQSDVAAVVLFLVSTVAAHMTGQDINVSAGAVMY